VFAQLTAAKKKKSGKNASANKAGSKKKRGGAKSGSDSKKVEAVGRGLNTFLLTLLILVIVAGAGWMWVFLGKPGLPTQPQQDRSACLELYFYDSAVSYLVPVHRRVVLAPNDKKTERAIREFAIGPHDPSLARVYPANIPVPSVTIEGRTAVVDLPSEILRHMGGTAREGALLDAITLTAVAAGECRNVRLLVGGEIMETTVEGYIIDNPLEPPDAINKVPNFSLDSDSQWVTVYFLRDSDRKYLFPLTLEVMAGTPPVEEAVKALLNSPPRIVDPPPLRVCPTGYSLERLAIENSIAHVDLGVPNTETAFFDYDINIFMRALYQTLRDNAEISGIDLSFNGRPVTSYGRFTRLEFPSQNDCWNAEYQPVGESIPLYSNPLEGGI